MKCTHWSDYVRNMRHRGARGSSQVHDLCSRLDMDLVHSSQNSCSQLGAKRIPGSVFNLCLSFLKNSIIIIIYFFKTLSCWVRTCMWVPLEGKTDPSYCLERRRLSSLPCLQRESEIAGITGHFLFYIWFYSVETLSGVRPGLSQYKFVKTPRCFNLENKYWSQHKPDGDSLTSTLILFSPYTDSPTTMFFVTRASSFPREMNTPVQTQRQSAQQ